MAILKYGPGEAFPGVIGRTAEVSAPAWPAPVLARESQDISPRRGRQLPRDEEKGAQP
jgi:hypothetical protein